MRRCIQQSAAARFKKRLNDKREMGSVFSWFTRKIDSWRGTGKMGQKHPEATLTSTVSGCFGLRVRTSPEFLLSVAVCIMNCAVAVYVPVVDLWIAST